MSSNSADPKKLKENNTKHVTEKKKISGTKAKQFADNIQGNSSRSQKIKSDFICYLKCSNKLPLIPCEPKFLKMDTYSDILNDVSNSDVLKTIKYPVYPPTVPLPFIGFDPFSKNLLTKNDETKPEDMELLSVSISSFTEAGNNERPTSTFTGQFLREVEYNDGMIFSEKNIDPHLLTQQVLESIKKPVNPLSSTPTESNTEENEETQNQRKLEEIQEEFEMFSSVPVNSVEPQLKPVRVYEVLPDPDLYENHYIIGKFEDKNISFLNSDSNSSILIRPYEKEIQPQIRTQPTIIQHIGEVLQVDSEDPSHYKWKNTFNVNVVDKISRFGVTENYIVQYHKEQSSSLPLESNSNTKSIPVYPVTYAPIESKKIVYLKKIEDGQFARTDIHIERAEAPLSENPLVQKLRDPDA